MLHRCLINHMKTSPQSAQLNSSHIHYLESLSKHHPSFKPLTTFNKKKRTITLLRANKNLKATYQENILRLLDELNSPMLMLPRVAGASAVRTIGFFTDLRFTGHATLAQVAKMARSFNASIVIFNIAESHLPQMDPAYAASCFDRQGLDQIDGVETKLVNLRAGTPSEMEKTFAEHNIGMLTVLRERKNLLYDLIA